MSGYTESLIEDAIFAKTTLGEQAHVEPPAPERHVLFQLGRLHVQKPPEPGYLGFTECGRMIPADALVGNEIPDRLHPSLCAACARLLARGEAS